MTSSSPITLLFTGLPARADKFLTGISTVALVRLNGRTLLFDTGPYAYRPILQGRLKKLGIDPGEIDDRGAVPRALGYGGERRPVSKRRNCAS